MLPGPPPQLAGSPPLLPGPPPQLAGSPPPLAGLTLMLAGPPPLPAAHSDSTSSVAVGESRSGSCLRNPVFKKQRSANLYSTLNQAKVIWDPQYKPRGLLGGHLNIRSILLKCDQVHYLLSNSNLDFLCLSETWLNMNSPMAGLHVPGYNIFRKDQVGNQGGGVIFYVREHLKRKQIEWVYITLNVSVLE